MAEANKKKLHQLHSFGPDKESPTDLLHKCSPEKTQITNLEQETDLNLGLSLGGIYTQKNTGEKLFLARSSSIAGVMSLGKDSGEVDVQVNSFLSLSRSCSLPTGVEQEHRQVDLRKLLAMKQAGKKTEEQKKKNWISKSSLLHPSLLQINSQERSSANRKLIGLESTSTAKGPSSSLLLPGPKDAELQITSGMLRNGAAEGSGDSISPSEPRNAQTALTIGTTRKSTWPAAENTPNITRSKKAKIANDMDVMKQMPSVTTIGDGPNGRRVEGFLYKYMKGQVSIVCVCHGSFLSPAEFVKHAGGKDVSNPMKHISVFPTSFSY
ncbi:ninja-family protein AFP3-like [Carica papaya]|uniref:ninja-family protein AFP3-like n=1 Tax=Carica papaya TaxID=3649 RepID=UPI000B8CDEB0|nr:ninja-family protein AFP3-like [Carica papaya]XP_021896326.1 ninja-family protein AFP3-like [Carica papaya]